MTIKTKKKNTEWPLNYMVGSSQNNSHGSMINWSEGGLRWHNVDARLPGINEGRIKLRTRYGIITEGFYNSAGRYWVIPTDGSANERRFLFENYIIAWAAF